jgi:hypothetical protein
MEHFCFHQSSVSLLYQGHDTCDTLDILAPRSHNATPDTPWATKTGDLIWAQGGEKNTCLHFSPTCSDVCLLFFSINLFVKQHSTALCQNIPVYTQLQLAGCHQQHPQHACNNPPFFVYFPWTI